VTNHEEMNPDDMLRHWIVALLGGVVQASITEMTKKLDGNT
jgi:hypothetical protein